jgi:hypothetical protein
MSDEELERLRDALTGLASVVLDSFDQIRTTDSSQSAHLSGDPSRPGPSKQVLDDLASAIPELDRELILERAAIMEFEGGLDRQAAEDLALSDCRRRRMMGPTPGIQ